SIVVGGVTYPSAFPDPKTVITNMRDVLYQGNASCAQRPTSSPICDDYNSVIGLFTRNYSTYRTNCDSTLPATPEPNSVLQHFYGFVPFNDKCTNDLNKDPQFATLHATYINKLEYPFDANNLPINPLNPYAFNPYTRLIHSDTYLGMKAAYAFSID